MRHPSRCGLSLTEAILILSILAVAAAILFPVFCRRHFAKPSPAGRCMSHLKMLGVAMVMYTQDHDDRYPPAWLPAPVSLDARGGYSWRVMLAPYARPEAFTCPTRPNANGFELYAAQQPPSSWCGWSPGPGEELTGGYALNIVHRQAGAPDPLGEGRGLVTDVGRPERLIVLSDAPDDQLFVLTHNPNRPGFVRNDPGATRHMDGAHYAFADGHVKWAKPAEVLCRTAACWLAVQGRH